MVAGAAIVPAGAISASRCWCSAVACSSRFFPPPLAQARPHLARCHQPRLVALGLAGVGGDRHRARARAAHEPALVRLPEWITGSRARASFTSASVFILILAAVNTGNNLLFMILACLLAGILISGVLSRAVLTGVELKFDLPEHIFAEQPVLAEVELRNEKQTWPSFSLRVVGEQEKSAARNSHSPGLFSLHSAAERRAPESGADVSRSAAFTARMRSAFAPAFRFGFFEKTRARGFADLEIIGLSRAWSPPISSTKCCRCSAAKWPAFFAGADTSCIRLRDYHADGQRALRGLESDARRPAR